MIQDRSGGHEGLGGQLPPSPDSQAPPTYEELTDTLDHAAIDAKVCAMFMGAVGLVAAKHGLAFLLEEREGYGTAFVAMSLGAFIKSIYLWGGGESMSQLTARARQRGQPDSDTNA